MIGNEAGTVPKLAADDEQVAARRAAIERDRATYRVVQKFSTDEYAGIALAETLPIEDDFDLRYAARLLPVSGRVLANHSLVDLSRLTGGRDGSSNKPRSTEVRSLFGSLRDPSSVMEGPRRAVNRIPASFPPDIEAYSRLFPALGKPAIHARASGTREVQDMAFAWQRVAGGNPMVLQAVTRVGTQAERAKVADDLDRALVEFPSHRWSILAGFGPGFERPVDGDLPGWFGVTDAHLQAATTPDDSLARAADERRLFLADYRDLAQVAWGSFLRHGSDVEEPKRVYAPLALFAWQPGTDRRPGSLVPVAIQCDQRAGLRTVFTPADGVRWQMARTVVQCADANDHELVQHLPHTHLVMESVILCARRNLASNHPLRILLEPHFQYTLAINDYAANHLISPGGDVDIMMAPTIEGSLEVVTRSLRQFRLDQASPMADVARRGVEKDTALAEFPWRDDAMEIWPVLHRFVDGYAQLYYDDATVADDHELAAFVSDLADPQVGNISGVGAIATTDALAEFLATIVWTATFGHAAVNYTQFPMFGSVLNAPGALYADAPDDDTLDVQQSWTDMLPPLRQAFEQATVLYQLAGVRIGEVGHYPPGWFHDRRAAELEHELRRQLRLVDLTIADRDLHRWLPYPYLRPSQTGQSIFI